MGPRAISRVAANFGLKKGQLLVCNFDDSSGTAGNGTTIEVLNPDHALQAGDLYAEHQDRGLRRRCNHCGKSRLWRGVDSAAWFRSSHKPANSRRVTVRRSRLHSPMPMHFAVRRTRRRTSTLGIPRPARLLSWRFPSVAPVKVQMIEVMSGFGINKGTGWSTLGPSGIQYNARKPVVYATTRSMSWMGSITRSSPFRTPATCFKRTRSSCNPAERRSNAFTQKTCATLVYSGSPLNAPVASALLPNGNLIVANTQGGNKLVELTPTGKILDTKTIDKSSAAHVFGLLATGTSDSNTVLFYTDTETNTLQELEQ